MAIEKECPNCDKVFKTYPSINSRCCSKECAFDLEKKETYAKYKCLCEVCGKDFLPKRPRDGGRFCSYKCSGKSRRSDKIDRNGYWYLYRPDHPESSKQGYIAEHKIVMEASLGHPVEAGMVVHHINEDKKDNRLCNLQYMSDSDHKSHHMVNLHCDGKISTPEQRRRASKRMKSNNPCKNMKRSDNGKFIGKL